MEAFMYYVATMMVSFFITSLLTPTPKAPDPAAFEDFDFPQIEDGTPQAVIFGDCWSGDWVVIDLGNYRTEAIDAPDA